MKKLMFLFAVVVMAAATQAASLKWSYSNSADTYKGTTWYLIAASALPTETEISAVDFQTWLADQAYTGKSKTTTYNTATKKYSNGLTATADSITKSGSYYLAIVSSDQKQVQVSQLIDGSTQVYGEKDTAITTSVTPSGTWMSFGAAPEPTSGVLLLLGMGALALRRRRA